MEAQQTEAVTGGGRRGVKKGERERRGRVTKHGSDGVVFVALINKCGSAAWEEMQGCMSCLVVWRREGKGGEGKGR